MVYVLEEPDISKASSLARSSLQKDQFAVPRFSSNFITFKPKHLFTFTRTQFTVVGEFTRLWKFKWCSELTLC